MADEGAKQSQAVWPLPQFRFAVEWGGETLTFQEVSGLDAEAQPIEYRAGASRAFSTVKMPGIKQYGNVTLKKGFCSSDAALWKSFAAIKMNAIERMTITVKLLDETGAPTMVWTLANAWPTKITATDLKSTGNEVAIEEIVIAHEGLTIAAR
jgi:phage tail-like protein